MIVYKKGDIFKGNEDIIVHGCNCFCTFGAGVAALVNKYYPEAYEQDLKTESGNRDKLGTFTTVELPHKFNDKSIRIINAYTQYDCGAYKKPFNYDAFKIVCEKIKSDYYDKTISMPKIGAGLAGGDWERISNIIEEVFPKKEIIVYIYE